MTGYETLMRDRKIDWRVQIASDISAGADDLFERRGMTRTTGLERLLAWFLTLDQAVQADAFGQLPDEIRPDILRIAWELAEMKRELNDPNVHSDETGAPVTGGPPRPASSGRGGPSRVSESDRSATRKRRP